MLRVFTIAVVFRVWSPWHESWMIHVTHLQSLVTTCIVMQRFEILNQRAWSQTMDWSSPSQYFEDREVHNEQQIWPFKLNILFKNHNLFPSLLYSLLVSWRHYFWYTKDHQMNNQIGSNGCVSTVISFGGILTLHFYYNGFHPQKSIWP
jgi:hypothetical protein